MDKVKDKLDNIYTKVYFLHDNAKPHIAKITTKKLVDLGWKVLPHPPYSPDLAPADYHLYRSLNNYFKGKIFKNNKEIKNDISAFFASKNAKFFKSGIEALPIRWQKVIDANGVYYIG